MKSELEFIKSRCEEVGECWEWAGEVTDRFKRIPCVRINGKTQNARRYAFGLVNGPVNASLRVSPAICGNPYCINPDHQKAITPKTSARIASKQGRLSGLKPKRIASIRNRAKLTREIGKAIFESDESGPVLAARYGVHRSVPSKIWRGILWRDMSSPFSGLGAL